MKTLENNKQEQVENLVDEAYENYQAGEKQKSFSLLEKAWDIFPNPVEYPEAYNIAKYSFEDYMREHDLGKSKMWLNKMIENNNNLHHSDEDCTFCVAKFYFESNEFKKAHNMFKEVVVDAGERYFEDEDPKYKDFYLHPEKYMDKE